MKALRNKLPTLTVGGQKVKIYRPGTFDISSVQYDADPDAWLYFMSRLRAVGLQLTQLHPRDQILLYYGFAEELEKRRKEEN